MESADLTAGGGDGPGHRAGPDGAARPDEMTDPAAPALPEGWARPEALARPDDGGGRTEAGAPAEVDEVDTALLDAIEAELADVELALQRLGDGTYGRCEACGQTLTDSELEEVPTGRFCRDHLPLGLS